ncbi:unnamed protein product [Prunus armeniaca]
MQRRSRMCWRSADGGKARLVMVHLFPSLTGMNDISKKLDLQPDMAKVRRALNILERFREWRWLLSEYRKKASDLPYTKDVKRWKQYSPNSKNLPTEWEEFSLELPKKRKADAKSSKDEVGTSRGQVPRWWDSKKISDMQNVQDISLKSPTTSSNPAICPGKKSIPKPSWGEDLTRMTAPPPNHRDPAVEPRTVKHGADLASFSPLEARMEGSKKARESSNRVKGSSEMRTASPKVDKSNSAGDACVCDMLKMNFLSCLSACVKLVDHIHQASDLGMFSTLSLEKKKKAAITLLKV